MSTDQLGAVSIFMANYSMTNLIKDGADGVAKFKIKLSKAANGRVLPRQVLLQRVLLQRIHSLARKVEPSSLIGGG